MAEVTHQPAESGMLKTNIVYIYTYSSSRQDFPTCPCTPTVGGEWLINAVFLVDAAMAAEPLDFASGKYVSPYSLLAFLNLLCGYGVFRRLVVRALKVHRGRLVVLDDITGQPTGAFQNIMEVSLVGPQPFVLALNPKP